MKLATLQRQMRNWLIDGAEEHADRLAGEARAGLHVYQNNYRSQLVGCLEQTFPHLRTSMGAEAFLQLAVAHIGRRPPQAWTLDAYGERFGETLRTLYPDNPDLHELAWIEWALATAFVARDVAPIESSRLADVAWDRARLVFTPSLALAPLTTNAADIWSALQAGGNVPEARMLEESAGIVVWRRGYVSRFRVLDQDELTAFGSARGQGGFEAMCVGLAGRLGEGAGVAKAGALLANWLANEMIIGVRHVKQN